MCSSKRYASRSRRAAARSIWAMLLWLLVGFPAPSGADTVHLRSGEKLIGKIITDERTKVVINSQALGKVEVPRDRIDRVEYERVPGAGVTNAVTGPAFVPPPPPAAATNVPVARAPGTNVPPASWWTWQPKPPKGEKGTDWIQLKSGEWLRGRLYGMQNRKLEFECDELDDLIFDWKDIHQVITPQALVSFGDRESAWGTVRVDREIVTVTGIEEVIFPRYDLVGIAPGTPRELDYWSGRLNVGLNLRGGNTEQAELFAKFKLERRTPNTHLKLEYTANYSEVNDVESVNNQRASESFDWFLTRRLFLRVPQAEYYSDEFQNIDYRVTAGGGVGYYLVDKPKVEWLVAGGPAYQLIRFNTVQAGEDEERSTPAFVFQSNLDLDLTKRTDLEFEYQVIVANQDSGGLTHHAVLTLEIDLTRRLDLDLSFIWDRISEPQADAAGLVPDQDDFRLNLALGIKF
jgi:putative salt-induced outer membrane protein YdiY